VTKLTRPRTRVCVNEENINTMIYASTILGLSLHVRWSSLISLGPQTLIQKYSRYVESLSWFVDNSGVLKGGTNGCIVSWDLSDITFPKVRELYLILTQGQIVQGASFSSTTHKPQLVSALLNKCPNLKILRYVQLVKTKNRKFSPLLHARSPMRPGHWGSNISFKYYLFVQ